jgi:hypothetical protein
MGVPRERTARRVAPENPRCTVEVHRGSWRSGAATPVARTMNAPGKTGVWSFVWWYGAEARSSIVAAMSGA